MPIDPVASLVTSGAFWNPMIAPEGTTPAFSLSVVFPSSTEATIWPVGPSRTKRPRSVATMTSWEPLPVRSAVATDPTTAPPTLVLQIWAPVAAFRA